MRINNLIQGVEDLRSLARLFTELEFKEGVEVGTNRGKFASFVCTVNPMLHLTCIDPWITYEGINVSQETQDAVYKYAVKHLAKFNITILRKTSMEAVRDFALASLDFVYIDGDHSFDYVVQDIVNWVSRVKKGGLILVHDYNKLDVQSAVNAYTSCHHINPYITREAIPVAYWVNT